MRKTKPHEEKTYNVLISEHHRDLIRRGLARLMPEGEADADEWATLSALVDALPAMEDAAPNTTHDLIHGVPA